MRVTVWWYASLATALFALPCPAGAQASFSAQARSLTAASQSDGLLWAQGSTPFFPDNDPPTATYTANHSDSAQAPGFGSFDDTAISTAPLIMNFIGPTASASSAQTSSLAPNLITASGSAASQANSYPIPPATLSLINFALHPPVPYDIGAIQGLETGESQFSASFTLAQTTPYHLLGSVEAAVGVLVDGTIPITNGLASVRLTGPSGIVADVLVFSLAPPHSNAVDLEGVLTPGSYTLSARSWSVAQGLCNGLLSFTCYSPTNDASFDLSLSLGGTPEVPGPSNAATALLGLALMASGTLALRRGRGRRSRCAA
jgi:hypothetical protein